jgi:hypothetical protein
MSFGRLLSSRPAHRCARALSAAQQPAMRKPFLVLGIETSCDDTAASVVSSDRRILSDIVAGQVCAHTFLPTCKPCHSKMPFSAFNSI